MSASILQRMFTVGRKELLHILRDPMTLFFTIFVPLLDLFLLGYAIETNVSHVKTVILDQANTQDSRALLQQFENDCLVLHACLLPGLSVREFAVQVNRRHRVKRACAGPTRAVSSS